MQSGHYGSSKFLLYRVVGCNIRQTIDSASNFAGPQSMVSLATQIGKDAG